MLSGISFASIWLFPAGLSELAYFFWFLVTSLIFFLAFTVFSVPYMAQGMELSPDYNERTGVVAFRTVISQLGAFLISGIYWFISLDRFDNMAHGMRYAGIIAGVLIAVSALMPALFCREHPSTLKAQNKIKKAGKVSLVKSFKTTLTDRTFLILISINMLMLLGLLMVSHLGYYVMVYHVFGGEKTEATGRLLMFTGLASQVATIFSVPVLTAVSRRIGKNVTLGIAMTLAIAGSLLKWVCYTPVNPWLAFIPNIVMGCGLAATWTLINAMVPDVVDLDDLKNGVRREGMYGAVHSWMCKLGMSLVLVVSGYVLSGSGFDVALGPDQAPHTITLIRLFFSLIPAVSIGLALLLLFIYPLKEKRVREIREQLEARNSEQDDEQE
jgi:GPH family glycoside/pentoside/hexuronide:cation symporter